MTADELFHKFDVS